MLHFMNILGTSIILEYNECRGEQIRFGSIFIKKSNQIDFFLKPKPVSNRPVSVRFGSVFLGKTGLVWFFQFGLGFFRFGLVFFQFGLVFFGSVRFYKPKINTKPNWSVFSKFLWFMIKLKKTSLYISFFHGQLYVE